MSGTETTPSGWYPDPERAGALRYWDGAMWTEHRTEAVYGDDAGPQGWQAPYASPRRGPTYRTRGNLAQASPQSMVAIGFAVLYIVLAQTVHVTLLGIIPLMAGFRAVQAKEPLAVVAIVVGVAAFALGIASFAQ